MMYSMICTKGLTFSKIDAPSCWIEVTFEIRLFDVNLYSISWWRMLYWRSMEIEIVLKNFAY